MSEIDVNAYATTAANAAATVPSVIETQQPGATGALRQVMTIGDPTTRANLQTIKAGSTAVAATDLPAVVALHPSSPTPTGTNSIGRTATDQTTNIIAATIMQNAAVALANGVNLNVQGYVSALISVTGTMGAGSAITFEASVDDTNFVAITGHQIGFAGNLTTVTISTGDFRFSCAGYKSIRARISAYGTGTMTAKGYVSVFPGHPTTVNSNIIAALPAGTNTIGKVSAGSSITGGLTTFTLISAATTNATSVKATAGTVYSLQASNTGAAVAFIKLYNLATAPTVGTSVAVKTLIVPAGGGIVLSTADIGLAFGTGIAIATTAAATTADTTAVALAQVVANIDYV